MKSKLLILFILISLSVLSQPLKLISWNIQNLGKSKDSIELAYIANIIINYDIAAIQEVSTSSYGIDAVKLLTGFLNYEGGAWVYAISEPTSGSGSERYAYVYNSSRVKIVDKPVLAQVVEKEIDREPFLAKFYYRKDTIMLVNFHAVPTKKRPQDEAKLLYKIDEVYEDYNIIFMGDFNLSQRHKGFIPLKNKGFAPSLIGVKTSLKMKVGEHGEIFSKEYDNFFYELDNIMVKESFLINFAVFLSLENARRISDHCPIALIFYIE